MKKLNNYDNHVKYAPKEIFSKFTLDRSQKLPQRIHSEDRNTEKNTFREGSNDSRP